MIYKRILCVLLAVVLLFTWPGFVPEAHAVAGIDDATIAVGLLFATWAGVTFASNVGAQTAVSNMISSKPAVATSIAGLITKNLVTDGFKLLLTGDVKNTFSSVLPEIQDFFHVKSDSVVSSGGGTIASSGSGTFLLDAPLKIPNTSTSDPLNITYDQSLVLASSGTLLSGSNSNRDTFRVEFLPERLNIYVDSRLVLSTPCNCKINRQVYELSSFSFYVKDDFLYVKTIIFYYVVGYRDKGTYSTYNSKLIAVDDDLSVIPTGSGVSFNQSKEIDGTQAINAFASAIDLPDTVYGDDRDRSLDIGAVAGVVAGGLAGSTAAPGLSPSDLIGALKEALGGTIVTPIPTTPPTEVTEATEATEPGETTPTIVTPGILEGMFGGLRGWLESILAAILAAIQAIPEKIDTFRDSLTTWWTEAIAGAKAWIEVKFQSIADWWTLFWADTIAAVKALGLTVSEFFTVTFPAWITDVKAWALALPQTIIDAILAALAAAFVPAAGYWDAKIATCMAAFPLFNSIISTGRGFGGFMSGLGSRPPVIYIDLGNSASWLLGGRTIFLDLTWYAQYKPTVDTILAGFLWGLFLWRLFLRLPGLLRGEGGTIDRLNTYLESKSTRDGE